MGLITTTEAKTYLNVTGSAEDTTIAELINVAGQALAHHCNRRLVAETVIEYQDGNGQRKLWLREPASVKPTIYVDANHAWGTDTQIAAADLLWAAGRDGTSREVVYLDNVFSEGQSNIKASYTSGFETAGMPEQVKQACRVQVARLYSEWKRATQRMDALASQSVAGWSQQFLDKAGVDPLAAGLIAEYVTDGF